MITNTSPTTAWDKYACTAPSTTLYWRVKTTGVVPQYQSDIQATTVNCTATGFPGIRVDLGEDYATFAYIYGPGASQYQVTMRLNSSSPTYTLATGSQPAFVIPRSSIPIPEYACGQTVQYQLRKTIPTPITGTAMITGTVYCSSSSNTSTAYGAGDVHSNGSISGMTIPSIKNFFTDGVGGIVSASSGIGIGNDQLMGPNLLDWRMANYGLVKTSAFTALENQAKVNAKVTSLPAETITAASIVGHCGAGSSGIFKSSTSVTISSPVAFGSSCNDRNVVYFIQGDLTINSNITDTSTTGTLTFVVSGNVTVASAVTRADGVYAFGGFFNDNPSSNATQALTVNGALLGLAGASPSSNTGTFSNGSVIGLGRDLGTNNSTTPAEVIVYQPKYLARVASFLGSSTFTWEE